MIVTDFHGLSIAPLFQHRKFFIDNLFFTISNITFLLLLYFQQYRPFLWICQLFIEIKNLKYNPLQIIKALKVPLHAPCKYFKTIPLDFLQVLHKVVVFF